MSVESLNIYNKHRKSQVENGKFSEIGLIGAIEILGIFDDHYYFGKSDGGNQPMQAHQLRFLVDSIPTFTERSTVIKIRNVDYVIMKADKDENGVPRLWLK